MFETVKEVKQGESAWGELKYPNEFIVSPDGKVPLERYIEKYPVKFKVQYEETKEQIIPSASPRFIQVTEVCDHELIFENGFEIKGVGTSIWNGVSTPYETEIITRKVRPNPKKIPKLQNKKK